MLIKIAVHVYWSRLSNVKSANKAFELEMNVFENKVNLNIFSCWLLWLQEKNTTTWALRQRSCCCCCVWPHFNQPFFSHHEKKIKTSIKRIAFIHSECVNEIQLLFYFFFIIFLKHIKADEMTRVRPDFIYAQNNRFAMMHFMCEIMSIEFGNQVKIGSNMSEQQWWWKICAELASDMHM